MLSEQANFKRPRRESAERHYSQAVKARVKDGVVLCPHHWKKLARITPEGIELWCKNGGHAVMLSYSDILKALEVSAK